MLIRPAFAALLLALPFSVDTCDGCAKNTPPTGSMSAGGEDASVDSKKPSAEASETP